MYKYPVFSENYVKTTRVSRLENNHRYTKCESCVLLVNILYHYIDHPAVWMLPHIGWRALKCCFTHTCKIGNFNLATASLFWNYITY